MKLTLAFAPGACAIVPYILLKEAGADFDTHNVNLGKGANFSPEYLKELASFVSQEFQKIQA